MRPVFTYSVLAAALLVGACKGSEQERGGTKFEKSREPVPQEPREIPEAQQDPGDEPTDAVRERTDSIETARSVQRAEEKLAMARAEYKAEMTRQLVRIDARIAELDAKGDEKSRATAERLREHRAEFAARLEQLENEPSATWEHLEDETAEPRQQTPRREPMTKQAAPEP